MKKLSSKEIREQFLAFFEENGHQRVRSSSLVPIQDPTLLFTNAGMNQFKDVFVGNRPSPFPRATSSQKCMRVSGKHNDLENVGRTARHHTFFEMLGNFSFGDYFKREAIAFAWELVTGRFELDPDKLWITVFREDDEAFDIWTRDIGVPEARVIRMDEKDNFWSMGETGPCGPCSEIHIDQGEGPGGVWKDEDITGESDRFLELWNLVFMQFDRSADGKMTPLPKPSVDTGGGLERFTAVMQGHYSNYESDLFAPIIRTTAEMCGKTYHADRETDTSLQVIADHVRACTFLIGDGMLPSNEHRGYVLRRIMRRAIRHGKRLGFDRVFLPDISETVIGEMGEVYPELVRNRDFILNVVREEEKGFRRTLTAGLEILNEEIRRLSDAGETRIPGDVVFKLYDTYGFPVDLTEIIAAENEKGVDHKGFAAEMEKQRERGRASWKGHGSDEKARLYGEIQESTGKSTLFSGYGRDEDEAVVRAILSGDRRVSEAPEGMDVEIVTDRTPFYAESGGQVGDRGLIVRDGRPDGRISELVEQAANGQEIDLPGETAVVILDVVKPAEGLFVHRGRVLKGKLSEGDTVNLLVDSNRRNRIRANHSATHLLQYALRRTLGEHVKQSGSWVGPDRLRFDFTHFQAVTPEELAAVEHFVNEKVITNVQTETDVKSLEQAQKEGAIAFFGEKYGDEVRVVTITPDSVELCGGTHVRRSGDIGLFKILSESSIASGIRRIEAVTGSEALHFVQEQENALRLAAGSLSVSPVQVPEAVLGLFEQQKRDRKAIEQLQQEKARLESVSLVENAENIEGIPVLCTRIDGVDPKNIRDYGQQVLDKLGSGMVCLASEKDGKLNFLLAVSEEFRKEFPAGKTLGPVAAAAGGRGGGRPDMAQAGGGEPSKIEEAFGKLKELIREKRS